MCEIKDGVIYLTKGDRGEIPVVLKDRSGTVHPMATGDKLVLTVRAKTGTKSSVLIRVESTTNTIIIHGSESNIPVGQYSCDIQYNQASMPNDPITVFPVYTGNVEKLMDDQNWSNFWITPEVSV